MSVISQLQETRVPGWALPVCSSAGPPSCLSLLGDRDAELGLGQGETLSWRLSLGGGSHVILQGWRLAGGALGQGFAGQKRTEGESLALSWLEMSLVPTFPLSSGHPPHPCLAEPLSAGSSPATCACHHVPAPKPHSPRRLDLSLTLSRCAFKEHSACLLCCLGAPPGSLEQRSQGGWRWSIRCGG